VEHFKLSAGECLVICCQTHLVSHRLMSQSAYCQAWSSRDLSLGLETSRDWILKVLVLVLVPRVSVSVLVLKVLGLGLGLETTLWLLNKRKAIISKPIISIYSCLSCVTGGRLSCGSVKRIIAHEALCRYLNAWIYAPHTGRRARFYGHLTAAAARPPSPPPPATTVPIVVQWPSWDGLLVHYALWRLYSS